MHNTGETKTASIKDLGFIILDHQQNHQGMIGMKALS